MTGLNLSYMRKKFDTIHTLMVIFAKKFFRKKPFAEKSTNGFGEISFGECTIMSQVFLFVYFNGMDVSAEDCPAISFGSCARISSMVQSPSSFLISATSSFLQIHDYKKRGRCKIDE